MTIDELSIFFDNIEHNVSPNAEITFLQYDSSDNKAIVDYVNSIGEELRYTCEINTD